MRPTTDTVPPRAAVPGTGPRAPPAPDDPASLKVVPARHYARWVAAVAVIVLVGQFVHGLTTNPVWEWGVFRDYVLSETIVQAVWVTLQLTAYATVRSTPGTRPRTSPPHPPAPEGSAMATVLSVSGSPSATSRTARLLRHLDTRLTAQGHQVIPLDVRTIPAEALLGADFRHPAIVEATELFARADGVVIGTPVYKAAYSGLLKSLLDLLPQYGLVGKTVLPLATGGSTAHVLAIDYALRPVLSSMGAAHIVQGWFTLDKDLAVGADGTLTVAPGPAEALAQVVDQFAEALGSRPAPQAATGRAA